MRASRAMTLIELLVSLSLLAVISVVAASWMTMMLRTQSTTSTDAVWDRSASAVFNLIARDIFVVDRLDVAGRGNVPRVEIADGKLRIRTRDRGYVGTVEYSFDPGEEQVTRSTIDTKPSGSAAPLLGDAKGFSFEIKEQSELVPFPVLRVRMERSDGLSLERTYTLAIEDTQ